MSSANTNLPSDTTKVAIPSDNENEEHVATLVKAFKDGPPLDPSYDAILKAVMENAKSREALMKAVMDNTKLHDSVFCCMSQPMAANFPKAVEITNDFKASADEPTGIVKRLTPPSGTRASKAYQVDGTNWILDVYGYRHANSNNVTVIILHSGSTPNSGSIFDKFKYFTLWTTPATSRQFHYPLTYDSKIEDGKYSYRIDYTHNINMIGPDGRNPIPVELQYSETFIAQLIENNADPLYLKFWQVPGRIHGMSVFNTSYEGNPTLSIGKLSRDSELVQTNFIGQDQYTGGITVELDY
ncbi:hypothetical protein BDP27DRAFT_1426151 [Rhodocollybia butyracea]|uniref:Uncharacterized protein n=1 Tax=Rhodocollybia butyracea TaxID=206335 RepID=A0A9P5U317_9AGAR|nr:hypothetical protein BDP27DRAFT_1426151 [Rhodocollybia butyracea]